MENIISDDHFIELLSADFPQFKVNKSNLAFPTSDFVISYYTMMLEAVLNMNDATQVWAITEDQNIFLNSYQQEGGSFYHHLAYYNLCATIKWIFNRMNPSSNFLYTDLIMPENTPRRTMVLMQLMLNYYLFLVQMENDLNDGMTACEEKSQQRKVLAEQRDRLLQQLHQAEEEKIQCVENLKEIKSAMDKFNILNEEKQNIIKDMHTHDESVKRDLMKIEEKEQSLQDLLTKLENEEKYYLSEIVSDQGQVMDTHSKFVSKKDDIVKRMKSLEEKVATASKKTVQLNKVSELQQKINSILRDEKFMTDSQSKQMDFKYLHDTIKNLNDSILENKENDVLLRNKICEAEETVLKLKNEYVEYESHQASITSKGKERINKYNGYIEKQKLASSQINSKLVKESPEMEETKISLAELIEECDQIIGKMKTLDNETKETYEVLEKEMNDALSSMVLAAQE